MADQAHSVLLSFPPHPPNPKWTETDYNSQARKFHETVAKLSSKSLISGPKGEDDFLQILNPQINSISYLHVLLAHIAPSHTSNKTTVIADGFAPNQPLWIQMNEFMQQFDPVQIRYSGSEMRTLIELTAQKAELCQQPAAAIQPVRTALLRLDSSNATFTSSHKLLPRLCLLARDFYGALPVLDKDIYHFPSQTTKGAETTSDPLSPYLASAHESSSNYIHTASGLTSKLEYQDHLLYHLWGAMCYMGVKDWDRATLFLEVVLMSPTANTASKIQADAYKKWVLVSLLRRGRKGALPKTTNTQASRMYTQLGVAYDGLADVFRDSLQNEESNAKLVAEANAGNQMWIEDANLGLVKQVINAYRYFSISQLGDTYAALPIAEVASRTFHENNADYTATGQYLVDLIDRRKLNASISKPTPDPSSWILRFHDTTLDGPLSMSEEQQLEELTRAQAKVHSLMSQIKEQDRKFGLSKENITDQKKLQASIGELGGPVEEPWNGPPDAAFDEDMMSD